MNRPMSLVPPSLTEGPDGPRFLGPYLLMERIGKGGTAVVYKAKRRGAAGFEKQVVVKTILPELAGDPRFVALFTEEAKLSAQLFHTNIAQVQDFGVLRGTPFLEIELLTGWDLRQLWDAVSARGERLPLPIVLHILTEACRGLAYAHTFVDSEGELRPIIHRDVSPANIMVCRDGAVKLLDFGLASVTRGETLSIDTFQGKVAYMSPEQLELQQLDRTADVFAFGVVLYELLTGQRLFAGDTDLETLVRLKAFAVAPPSRHNKQVPRELDRLVARALARDPKERFGSAVQLMHALDALQIRAASRSELLAYIGSTIPGLFATPCEGCGASVAAGNACESCRTYVGELAASAQSPEGHLPSRRLFVVGTPPQGVLVAAGAGPSPESPQLWVLLAALWKIAAPGLFASWSRARRRGWVGMLRLRRRSARLGLSIVSWGRARYARLRGRP